MSIAVTNATDLCARTYVGFERNLRNGVEAEAPVCEAIQIWFFFFPARYRFRLVKGVIVPSVFLFADLFWCFQRKAVRACASFSRNDMSFGRGS